MEIRGGPRSGVVRLRTLKAGDTFRKINEKTGEPASESIYMKTAISPEEKESPGWRDSSSDRARCVTLRSGSWSYQNLEDSVLVVTGYFQVEGEGQPEI
jgi:hypothetical protein